MQGGKDIVPDLNRQFEVFLCYYYVITIYSCMQDAVYFPLNAYFILCSLKRLLSLLFSSHDMQKRTIHLLSSQLLHLRSAQTKLEFLSPSCKC